jgi:peroxiredoxin (alkyl hydroperoxide reductase subunit C)
MSLIGQNAPAFELPSTKNLNLDDPVSLAEHKGHWLVLVFYPADFTFVCPTEMLAFSGAVDKFAAEDASVVAISTDGIHCHEAWQEFVLGRLAFPLGSDTTMEVTRSYGVLIEDEGIARRALFIIDPEGIVRYEVIHDSEVGRSVDEPLRVLRALQIGERTPADWQPGDATISAAR